MNLADVMGELESLGSEQTRKTFRNHGAPENMFGVKVGDLKKVLKKIKGQQALALDLYATGNSDAMYLAGLVADGRKMSKEQLDAWAREAPWYMIAEYTVAWVASESPHGRELALAWMASPTETVACAGWCTYGALLALKPDAELDLGEIGGLLDRVAEGIHDAPNRVRYCMNGFVIAVGTYVAPLLDMAKAVAARIGKVHVDMGGTACKVPAAGPYIEKVESMGKVGAKRKTVKC